MSKPAVSSAPSGNIAQAALHAEAPLREEPLSPYAQDGRWHTQLRPDLLYSHDLRVGDSIVPSRQFGTDAQGNLLPGFTTRATKPTFFHNPAFFPFLTAIGGGLAGAYFAPSKRRRLRDMLVGAMAGGTGGYVGSNLVPYLYQGFGELTLKAPALSTGQGGKTYLDHYRDAVNASPEAGKGDPEKALALYRKAHEQADQAARWGIFPAALGGAGLGVGTGLGTKRLLDMILDYTPPEEEEDKKEEKEMKKASQIFRKAASNLMSATLAPGINFVTNPIAGGVAGTVIGAMLAKKRQNMLRSALRGALAGGVGGLGVAAGSLGGGIAGGLGGLGVGAGMGGGLGAAFGRDSSAIPLAAMSGAGLGGLAGYSLGAMGGGGAGGYLGVTRGWDWAGNLVGKEEDDEEPKKKDKKEKTAAFAKSLAQHLAKRAAAPKGDITDNASMIGVQNYLPIHQRRELTEEEEERFEKGKSRWIPRIFASQATRPDEMMADPLKQAVLWGLLTGGLGGLGGAAIGSKAKMNPEAVGTMALGGAGIGALAGSIPTYFSQQAHNEDIEEQARRLPPGAVMRDMMADPVAHGLRDRMMPDRSPYGGAFAQGAGLYGGMAAARALDNLG